MIETSPFFEVENEREYIRYLSLLLAPCVPGTVRLTGGQVESEGRLEICSSRSIWGTVCNRQWTDANTKVACRALGFDFTKGKYLRMEHLALNNPSAGSYQTYNTFDRIPATIPIAVDYVRCLGSENTTSRCTYISHSFSGCSHDDDIGIICPPGKSSKGTSQLMLLFFFSYSKL